MLRRKFLKISSGIAGSELLRPASAFGRQGIGDSHSRGGTTDIPRMLAPAQSVQEKALLGRHLDAANAFSVLADDVARSAMSRNFESHSLVLPFDTYDDAAFEWLCDNLPDSYLELIVDFKRLSLRAAVALSGLKHRGFDGLTVILPCLIDLSSNVAKELAYLASHAVLGLTLQASIGATSLRHLLHDESYPCDFLGLSLPSLSTGEAELLSLQSGALFIDVRDGILSESVAYLLGSHSGYRLDIDLFRRLAPMEWDWLAHCPRKLLRRLVREGDGSMLYLIEDPKCTGDWIDPRTGLSRMLMYP